MLIQPKPNHTLVVWVGLNLTLKIRVFFTQLESMKFDQIGYEFGLS